MTAKRILVVDDDERNRKLMDSMVRAEGYDCRTAEDGMAGLQACAEWQPDLILLDVMMPGMNGFEVAQQLKGDPATRNIPLIFLTALTDRESRLKGLEAGAEEFLNKPVDRIELGMRMRNLLRIKDYNDLLANHNQLLEEQVRQRTAELHDTQLEIVRRLGRAAEFRDNETGLHIIRMSKYSQLLAQATGLGETQAELILHAAPMHDIGKVGIPDAILLKPGKLTPDEWAIMQTHVAIGAEILHGTANCGLMTLAYQIALCHHEKWDGSGYPNRLVGEAIPQAARIVALADVFDALTSERPYKKAWPIEQAVAEIEAQKGRHFDPRLVQVFVGILPDILAVRGQYLDEPQAQAA